MRSWVEECAFLSGEIEKFYPWERSRSCRYYRRQFWQEWLDKASGPEPTKPSDQFEARLLAWHAARMIFEIDRIESLCLRHKTLDGIAEDFFALEFKRRALINRDGREAAQRLEYLVQAMKEIGDDVAPADALWAAQSLEEVRESFKVWKKTTLGFDPSATWWLETPVARAEEGLDALIKKLREEIAGAKGENDDPLVGTPVGAAAIEEELRTELVPCTVDDMLRIGREQAEWCRARMEEAAQEMGCTDWREALAVVKKDHVLPGEQEQYVFDLCREAIEWTEGHDLVTIHPVCRDLWTVDMQREDAQAWLPFLGYGGQKCVVSYPLPVMDHATKLMAMAGNCRAFTRAVVPHELIPGHHLQLFEQRRIKPRRQMFSTMFFVEGWTIHWELLQLRMGWAQTPTDRIGMLWWRLHRCNRIVVSLAFHRGEMTPDEMVAYLVEHGGQEKHTARSEVRRYVGTNYPPLYQCAYLIGGLQVHALYRELTEDRGMTPRQAHDAILSENAMPPAMLRERLTGEKPDGWDFAARAMK
jgi:hypothetical protein